MTITRELVADDFRLEGDADKAVLSMRVRGGCHLPERLWFKGPRSFISNSSGADSFLPVLLCCGMVRGLAVTIEHPVSKKLYLGAHKAMEIMCDWSRTLKTSLKRIKIAAPLESRPMTGTKRAAFFSGGIDSIYTVLQNRKSLSHLILAHGFDISLNKPFEFSRALKISGEFCRAEGFTLINIKTNAQRFTSPMDWGKHAHGPCIAAAGHLFSESINEIRIAASYWATQAFPHGSHPKLDNLWSSEALSLIHDGFELTRSEKVEVCVQSEPALKVLRVCFQGMGRWNNCGKCEKCLRTMVSLICCNALERAPLFPKKFDLEMVKALRLTYGQIPFWLDNLKLAERKNANRSLIEAIKGVIAEYESRSGIHD